MHTTNSRELLIEGRSVIVREMTVLQVRQWMADMQQLDGQRDVVGESLLGDCTLSDIQRMTTLTPAEIDGMRPSQLRDVLAVCKELNPDFFGLLRLLVMAPAA